MRSPGEKFLNSLMKSSYEVVSTNDRWCLQSRMLEKSKMFKKINFPTFCVLARVPELRTGELSFQKVQNDRCAQEFICSRVTSSATSYWDLGYYFRLLSLTPALRRAGKLEASSVAEPQASFRSLMSLGLRHRL